MNIFESGKISVMHLNTVIIMWQLLKLIHVESYTEGFLDVQDKFQHHKNYQILKNA